MKRYGADRDKEIQRLLQEMPEEGFRLLFDVYHMQLCVYVVQLTDSFQLAEDIVQDFFVAFWERKYYRAITGNFRSYLYTSVHNAALAVLKKKKLVPMELLTGVPVEIPQEAVLEREELERQEKELMLKLEKLPKQEIAAIKAVILEKMCGSCFGTRYVGKYLKDTFSPGVEKIEKRLSSLLFILFVLININILLVIHSTTFSLYNIKRVNND